MKLIDLSVPLEFSLSEPVAVRVETTDHAAGADILGAPAGVGRADFPDELGLSIEHVALVSHAGTHMDAPLHYGPLCQGEPARSIDQVPLDWCFAPGVLIRAVGDVTHGPVTRTEVEVALASMDRRLNPGDIVLIHTGADRLWGKPDYFTNFRGVSVEALSFILDAGVKVVGVDSFGFDPPFAEMLSDYKRRRDPSALWPAHILGRRREYCQLERLANLDRLAVCEAFHVACFPVRLRGAGAAWTRTVAILDLKGFVT